ncbi:uncharacterized protein [Nicotiana sylvestris]|uniref:uncharacterized protein n=1 Tax=Nicotiana sylvestris TaxID=4096 RepID=UPI00388CB746
MGPVGKDSRSKQDNQRYDHRSRNRESGSSSRFRNDRNTYESRDDDRNLKVRFGGYSFNVSTSELVAVLRSMGDKVRWPKEMRSNPNRRNPDHWCEFHNDHGHKTADCRFLQSEVDHILEQGYLTELFNEKGKQAYMKNRQEPPKPPSPKRTINVISGGEDINGISYTAANKISKVTITQGKRVWHVIEEESIIFDDADADGVLTPHNDALVISLIVHDTNVKRVLIDSASSVNIILLRVLREMQAEDRIIPKAYTLSGFDNSSVVTKGEGLTDVDSRPDTIQEPEENKNIKTATEELEPVVLFAQWPDKKVYVGANLRQGKRGYNQIKIDPEDEENTSFITDRGTYYYKVMPFGLKNAGATYQRLVTKIFQEHLGKTMEDHFELNEECLQALRNLKTYLSNPPLLAKLKAEERLLIYLTVSEVAVSFVLVREDQDVETRYPQLEKLALALIMASRKLRPYFQCHPIVVVTAYPLRNILHKHELSGAGLGIVLVPPTGETIQQAIKCHSITNNEAEYKAIIAGLELARELGIHQIIIKSDLQLVVNQMLETYTAREARIHQYLAKVRDLIKQFQTWKVTLIPRDENVEADALTNLASAADMASN